jgi:hypothetical protein
MITLLILNLLLPNLPKIKLSTVVAKQRALILQLNGCIWRSMIRNAIFRLCLNQHSGVCTFVRIYFIAELVTLAFFTLFSVTPSEKWPLLIVGMVKEEELMFEKRG